MGEPDARGHGRSGLPRRLRPGGRSFRSFRDSDDGSVTIETLFWIPFYAAILGTVTDLSMIYTVNADMWHVSFDTARRISKQEMTTTDAEAHVRAALPSYFADSLRVRAEEIDGHVEVAVSAPAGAFGAIGTWAMLDGTPVAAQVRLPIEGGTEPDFEQFSGLGVGAGAPAGS